MSKQNQFVFRGNITEIGEVQTGTSANGEWKSLDFTVKEKKEDYPQSCVFRLFGLEKVDNFMQYNSEGDFVDVSFNLTTNNNGGRTWNNIQAWKVFKVKKQQVKPEVEADEDDDLPF